MLLLLDFSELFCFVAKSYRVGALTRWSNDSKKLVNESDESGLAGSNFDWDELFLELSNGFGLLN